MVPTPVRASIAGDVIGSYWTLAGDRYPTGPSEVSAFPIQDRIEAASSAGYTGIGLMHADLKVIEHMIGLKPLAQQLSELNLRCVELEVITGWYATDERRRRSDEIRAELLRAAETLGAHHIKICGEFRSPPGPVDLMAQEFSRLCRQAAESGTMVTIEFIVASSIPDLRTALDIVVQAGEPNGKLCLDLWHVARARTPLTEIAALAASQIGHIELCGGRADLVTDLWTDTIHHRLLPGQGDFDTTGFLRATRRTGYRDSVGVEVISHKHRKLSLQEAAESAYNSTVGALQYEAAIEAD